MNDFSTRQEQVQGIGYRCGSVAEGKPALYGRSANGVGSAVAVMLCIGAVSGCAHKLEEAIGTATGAVLSEVLNTAANGERILEVSYVHSMRITHKRVTISIRNSGRLTLKTQDAKASEVCTERMLTRTEVTELKRLAAQVDWQATAADHTSGFDGTSVSITAGSNSAKVWAPEYDTAQRSLRPFNRLLAATFSMAGLGPDGLPLIKGADRAKN